MNTIIIMLAFMLSFSACQGNVANPPNDNAELQSNVQNNSITQYESKADAVADEQENTMYLLVGEHTLTVALIENTATEELKKMLTVESLTIKMSDYGGFEKVGSIGASLPRDDVRIAAESGDIVLYQGNSLVIFYAPHSWSYTRLGKINGITHDELKTILGDGDVTVTLSLTATK
jgi:hypothetical protein